MKLRTPSILASLCLLLPIGCGKGGSDASTSSARAGDPSAAKSADSDASAKDDAKKKDGPKLVRVEELEPTPVEERLPCTSHVEAFHSVMVKAQVAAQVLEVRIREGQAVEKGQLLFALDKRQAVLNLSSAKVQAETARNGERDAELQVEEAQDRITQAEIEARQSKRALDRRLESAKSELSSPAQLEDAQLAHDKAVQGVELAKNQLDVAKHALVKAKTEVESAAIQVQLQERALEDYEVRAPIDGVIPELTVRGGEWLAPQSEVCSIVANKRLILNLKRPQKELGSLAIGQRVDIKCDAYPGKTFVGAIDFLAPTIDMETGTFRARVAIRDAAEVELRPGMFVRAWIVTGTNDAALMIPKQAIVYDAQKPCAFVVRDGKAQRITIERGIDLKDAVEARNVAPKAQPGAFTRGDRVVVVGVDGLTSGGAVEVQAQ